MQNGFLSWHSFSLSKRGNAPEEYEDAFAGDAATGRIALADGASESSFAGDWARIIVQSFVATTGPWNRWLPAARARWLEMAARRELPWYAEEKFEQGAFATLLGFRLLMRGDEQPNSWVASAVGDSCLFQIRKDTLVRAFPLVHSKEFSNHPELLGSRAGEKTASRTKRKRCDGDWQKGDLLMMMTDALAQWFLEQVEKGETPWKTLVGTPTNTALAEKLEELLDRKELRNDDVTLLVISPT
jgi:hypothetical protein